MKGKKRLKEKDIPTSITIPVYYAVLGENGRKNILIDRESMEEDFQTKLNNLRSYERAV